MDWIKQYIESYAKKNIDRFLGLFTEDTMFYEEPFDVDIGGLGNGLVKQSVEAQFKFMRHLEYEEPELIARDGETHVFRLRYSFYFNDEQEKSRYEDIIIAKINDCGLCYYFYDVPTFDEMTYV